MPPDPNLPLLERTVASLGDLADEMMLVGGCAAGLLVTDPGAAPLRPTRDVDLVVEVASYVEYERLGARLRGLGFAQPTSAEDPICRWSREGLVLDVMPLDEKILGFSNRWYGSALASVLVTELPSGRRLKHIDAPHFLASKLAAFHSRGAADAVMSADLEDLVIVVDGRDAVLTEVERGPVDVANFVSRSIQELLADRLFMDALPGYFVGEFDPAARARRALSRLSELSSPG